MAASIDQIFVVGTGRCGSTLVSNMLRLHPRVTSLSEFMSFVTDLGFRIETTFPDEDVDGQWLWQIISTAWPRQNLMLHHDVAMEEVLYPHRAGTHRYNTETGVPAILQVTLPHLTSDFDDWFDELKPIVSAFPPAPVGIQMRRLFEWLTLRDGGSVWVERSGGGLRGIRRLIEHFPMARFIHLVRDGRDTAISMSRHHGFKMAFVCFQLLESLGDDPFVSNDRRWEGDLPDELAALLPERFTRQAFLDFETPPPLCAYYWSGEIMEGLRVLDELDPERVLTIRYEDILEKPHQTVEQMIRYVLASGADDETSFVERATALVRPPRTQRCNLDMRIKHQLDLACRPGLAALEDRGLFWPDGG